MEEMVDVGGHSLHVRCTGSGGPTVVIDTGHGDLARRWQSIQDQLSQGNRVCTYDRAGYGQSEPGPMPRHSQRVANELRTLLEEIGVEASYILVGHSLGGLNVQAFASQYPDLVAGLVLIDPPPLGFITGKAFPDLYQMAAEQASGLSVAAEQARHSSDPEERAKGKYLAAVASELQSMFAETADQVAAIASFGDTPLTVMAAGQSNPAFGEQAEAFQRFWIEQNRQLALRSTNGRFVLAQESSHYLHEDVPELVLDAIRQMVEGVRTSR